MTMDFLTSNEPLYIFARVFVIFLFTLLFAWRIRRITSKHWSGKLHLRFSVNFISILIYIIGFSFAFNQIPGFSSVITTLLAGSGIVVLAMSLAAQETLSNLISGITISTSKPFNVGDRVRLPGTSSDLTGYVEDITLRHTVIRTFVNSRIIVPNSVINKEMIENSNFIEGPVANFLDITITYGSDLNKAMGIMADKIAAHPNYVDTRDENELNKPKVTVFVRNLSLYGVELRASVWTGTVGENFETCSEIRTNIKGAFDKEGIKFAEVQVLQSC